MPSVNIENAPFRDAEFMPVDLDVETRDDGTLIFQSNIPMPDHDENLARTILKSARQNGRSTALAQRGFDGDWIEIDYETLLERVLATAQWMVDTVPSGRAFMILSENSIDAAIFNVACYFAGLIHTPVSPSFAMTEDYERLRHVANLTEPAAIFVSGNTAFAAAAETVIPDDVIIVTTGPGNFSKETFTPDDIYKTEPTPVLYQRIDAIDPTEICTYMMTSGSTGLPKVVTLSMSALSANTAQTYASVGQAAGWDEVMLDWLPWHHAAGLSVLRSGLVYGGTLYIDAGKPLPGFINTTIQNLTEIPVAYFNNVPTGYAMLVEAMETNPDLKSSFFKKMRLMLYGGAGLAQPVYDRLQEMAVEETGHRIHMTTGYGMTETVSGCMTIHYPTQKVGIGLPCPGVIVKLIPTDDRFEVRLKGPNLMSGYLKAPEKNAEVFDEDGFYRTGDLARLINPDDLSEGLAFAGRMAEEFKLLSGSWVYGGELKARLLKRIGDDVMEGVLCDANRPYLTLMLWARPGRPAGQAERIAQAISEFNQGPGGQSTTIRRFTLLSSPPNAEAHEMSDKGTINRRAVLANRSSVLDDLYADPAPEHIYIIDPQ